VSHLALSQPVAGGENRAVMQWPGERTAVASATTAVVVRVVSEAQSRRLRFGVPLLLVIASTGLTLALPAFVGRGVFDLMLLPVLLVAVGFGLWPALVTVVLTGAMVALALPPVGLPWLDDPIHAGGLSLHVAEGAALALIGAALRATLKGTLKGAAEADTLQQCAQDPEQPVGPFLAEHLTHREIEVLRLAAGGRSVDELADDLYLSPNTVKTHIAHTYEKLGAHNRAEAVALGVHSGLIRASDLMDAARLPHTGTPASGMG
jgi:DNA-binding CsgD family transcriptional regulator